MNRRKLSGEVFRHDMYPGAKPAIHWVFFDDGRINVQSANNAFKDGFWKVEDGQVLITTTANAVRWRLAAQGVQESWAEAVERIVAEVIVT